MANKQDSNLVSAAFAEEQTLKTLPTTPVWFAIEPNSFSDFGSDIKNVSRSPINASRQKKRGTTVDLDAIGGWSTDFTQSNMTRLLQGFFFADAHEKPDTQSLGAAAITLTSVATSNDSFNAASGLDDFLPGHLVLASGFTKAGNNGLKTVVTTSATVVTVAENLVDEATPSLGRLEAVGFKFAAGDLTLTATTADITLGLTTASFTDFDLTVGEWIFIGGDSAATVFALNLPGYARVKSIAAKSLVLDESTFTATTDTGATKTIQIFFGKAIKNEKLASDIVRRTYQIERQIGNDGVGIQSEYLVGAIPNEFSLKIAQNDKITADLTFVGMDTEVRTGTEAIKTGTRVVAQGEDALNTSSEVYRSKLSIADGVLNNAALFAYVTEVNFSIKNNIAPNKAIGVLGAFEASVGDFEVTGSVTAYFDAVAALASVRDNEDVSLNVIVASNNHGVVFDVPTLNLAKGRLQVEKDAPITIPLDTAAFENALGHTMLVNFFAYLPTVAMPA
jgi:hypothetical protein